MVGDLFQVSATPPPPNDPDASAAILAGLLERVEKALGIDHPEDTPYWAAPALRLRLSLTKAGVGGPDACEKIGLALAGPLDAFGVPAATLSPEKLDHYIFSMIPVLLTLAENRKEEDDG